MIVDDIEVRKWVVEQYWTLVSIYNREEGWHPSWKEMGAGWSLIEAYVLKGEVPGDVAS